MEIKSINVFKKGVEKCLGDLEAQILDILWNEGEPLSAREVTSILEQRKKITFNAVSTVLNRLEKKDLVLKQAQGKRYFFVPAMTKKEYSKSIVLSGLKSILSDKKLLSTAGLSGRGGKEEIDPKALDLLKEFLDTNS